MKYTAQEVRTILDVLGDLVTDTIKQVDKVGKLTPDEMAQESVRNVEKAAYKIFGISGESEDKENGSA